MPVAVIAQPQKPTSKGVVPSLSKAPDLQGKRGIKAASRHLHHPHSSKDPV
jgi:hypothetical protein